MKQTQKGFTLIELLVVVGILAILAIAALIAINPLEAQRRARDSTRLADIARLSAVFETYVNDNGDAVLRVAGYTNPRNSQAALLARSQSCSANWMGLNVCSYLKQVPADPQNSRSITIATNVAGTRGNDIAGYGFAYNLVSGEYEFCTHLEAEKSEELLISDGGSGTGAANTFETGTDLSLNCVPS